MHLQDPTFPPLLSGHGVKSPERPFHHAIAHARATSLGAGDVVWSRNVAQFDCAIILEPDITTPHALQMLYLAMVAIGDAIGALAPPEVGVTYQWPQTIKVNGAKAGEMRIAVDRCDAQSVPAWMVLGCQIALRADLTDRDPGWDIDNTSLMEEGAGDIDRTRLIESYCRHFLTWLHTWQEDGFGPVHEAWLFRAEGYHKDIEINHAGNMLAGVFMSLDDDGNMLLKNDDGVHLLRTDAAARDLVSGEVE